MDFFLENAQQDILSKFSANIWRINIYFGGHSLRRISLSNLLILKGKNSDPTPPKSIPSHPSHPCALQCKASSYPGSPSSTLPLCLCVCSCVCSFTLRAYSFAHNFLCIRVFVCFSCNFISASYASAGPWKAPLVWLKLASGG